jgi:hypothetical protein
MNRPDELGERVARLEAIQVSVDATLERLTTLADYHDRRIISIEQVIARGLGAIAITVLLATLLAPFLRDLLGFPV